MWYDVFVCLLIRSNSYSQLLYMLSQIVEHLSVHLDPVQSRQSILLRLAQVLSIVDTFVASALLQLYQ